MKKYIDYIINKQKRIITGNFDEAYKNVDDVWPTQHNVSTLKHKLIISYLGSNYNQKILDIGCGYGDFVNYLSELGYKVIGTDISKNALIKGKNRFGNKLHLHQSDILNQFPYKDNSFDVVICLGVFQFILHQLTKAIKEIKRVLSKNGLAIISLSLPKDPIGKEFYSNYNDIYLELKNFFYIENLMISYDQDDLSKNIILEECVSDGIYICRNNK